MFQLNCIIVDDEKPARDGIRSYLERIKFLNCIGEAKNINEANELLARSKIDVVFLDIQLPKVSGVEFIRNLKITPLVIFTTAYREYAAEGFELDAVDYLIKPITFLRFKKACEKALSMFRSKEKDDSNQIFIKENHDFTKIKLNEIRYLEADDDYVSLYMHNGERHMILMPLKKIELQLNENFVRTHRSYVINILYVTSIEKTHVMLNEIKIPISRSLKETVRKSILGDSTF